MSLVNLKQFSQKVEFVQFSAVGDHKTLKYM